MVPKTMSLPMCVAMLLSASSGAMPVLAEALVQEATPSEAEYTHPNARIVSFNKDAGVEQNVYVEFADVSAKDPGLIAEAAEQAENEVGEDTLVQK